MVAVLALFSLASRRNRISNSLPVNDVPEGKARFPKTWITLGLLVLAHAVFGANFTASGTLEAGRLAWWLMMGVLSSSSSF
jgi:hypothetical protein